MLRHSFKLLAISVICAAGTVEAQVINLSTQPTLVGDTDVLVQHHCSTAKEGALRGTADLVRSYGQATRNVAVAECYAAQAHEQELRNRQLVTVQYYERKEMYEASKSRKEASVPYVTVSKNDTPKASTPVVSDDGSIHWPKALMSDDYRGARQTIEVYFNHRGPGYNTGIGTPEFDGVHSAIGELTTTLKSRISETSSGDYMVAKNFLKNLEKAAG